MAAFLVRHWFLLCLVLGLAAALSAPGVTRRATDYWDPRPTIALSLFLIAWTMPTHSILAEARRPFAGMWAAFVSYGILPPAAWAFGELAPGRDIQIGLIIVSTVPCTLASAVLWTRLAGGNEATALLTVLVTTLTSWFVTTAWLYGFTGAALEIDALAMMRDLVLILIVPVGVGQAIRFIPLGARIAERHKIPLGVVSQTIILAIIIKAGGVVGLELRKESVGNAPIIFLLSVAFAAGLHLTAVAGGFFSSRWLGFDRGRQIAVAFAASQKTLPVSLVLYEEYFKAEYPFAVVPLLFYHVGQLLLDTIIAKRMAQGRDSVSPSEMSAAQ